MCDSYVSIDLETTGLDPKKDKITEIGAVKVEEGRVTDRFHTLVNPRRELEERIREITGIEDDMLKDAPGIEEVIGNVLDFCQDLPLLGHHVIFDYSFLKRAAVNNNLKFECRGIGTLALCRKFMPKEEKKNLTAACRYFNIENENAHRALSDAWAAHKLYQELKKRCPEEELKAFQPQSLVYKVKKEQPAAKRQKERLRDLIKYHKICVTVQIEYMSRNEVSRMTDKIISQYGRIKEVKDNV